jgi:hypothetical protein
MPSARKSGYSSQEIHQRFGAGDPLQLLWRLFAHLAQPLDHLRMPPGIGRMMGMRTRQEHLEVIGKGLAQTDFPLLHPARLRVQRPERTVGSSSGDVDA